MNLRTPKAHLPLLVLLVLVVLLLKVGCCTSPATGAAQPGPATQAAIALSESVQVGGSRQWLLIRGDDRSKPVLLFIHGGPGSPYAGFARDFQSALEKSFVVVQWDQRGAGKSYPGTDPESMKVQQFLSDTHDMVLHLKRRFQRDRIYLLGHSWGAYLGLQEAWRHPENLHGYVGTGQMIDLVAQERSSHRWAVAQARQRGDESALRALEALGEPPYADAVKGMQAKYESLWSYGGMIEGETGPMPFVRGMLCSPDYSLVDIYHFVRGGSFSLQQLARNEAERFWRLQAPGPDARFATPVYFIAGEHDRVTPTPLVEFYAQALSAPDKQVFVIPGAGHFAFYTHAADFNNAMLQVLSRTAAQRRQGGDGAHAEPPDPAAPRLR